MFAKSDIYFYIKNIFFNKKNYILLKIIKSIFSKLIFLVKIKLKLYLSFYANKLKNILL